MGADSPEIMVGQVDGGLYLGLLGRATRRVCPTVDRVVADVLAANPGAPVTLDLTSCAWVDSTFAGWLLGLLRRCGRGVRLAGCSERCRVSLERMQLRDFFEFCEVAAPADTAAVACPETDRPDPNQLKLMLAAHEQLASLGGSNARVFGPVVAALRAQLERGSASAKAEERSGAE